MTPTPIPLGRKSTTHVTIAAHLDLDGLLGERRTLARQQLADAMRALSTGSVEPDDLSATGDLPVAAFFEPRLFSQLGQHGVFDATTLSQLTLSDAVDRTRPVPARTDRDGVLALPGLGLVRTTLPSTAVTVALDAAGATATLAPVGEGGAIQEYAVEPAMLLPGTRVELVAHVDPVLAGFLAEHVGPPADTEHVDARDHAAALADALALIEQVSPGYHRLLVESLRGVVLYRHATAESFAALGMHGLVFLNVPESPTLDYFVEELTHQGGHVLFSEATLQRSDFFLIDPDSPLSEPLARDDARDLYGFFHGLFTEHMESQIVRAVLDSGLVGGEHEADFRHHLDVVTGRLDRDLALVGPVAGKVFSELGLSVYDEFRRVHADA